MPDTFDRAQHGLRPVHVETVAGSVYVCLADDPPAFDAFREQLAPLLAPHNLANAKLAFESTLVERANWKLVMENARECYHCVVRHPELSLTFPVKGRRSVQFADASDVRSFPGAHGRGRPADRADRGRLVAGDALPGERRRDHAVDGWQAGLRQADVRRCGGDIGSMRWALEPHSFMHATCDTVFMFSAMPTGPEETVVTSKWLVHKDAVEGVDYTVEGLTELWTKTNLQDLDLCENNQAGVNSVGYVPGPYSEETEHLVMRFVDWYCAEARAYLGVVAPRRIARRCRAHGVTPSLPSMPCVPQASGEPAACDNPYLPTCGPADTTPQHTLGGVPTVRSNVPTRMVFGAIPIVKQPVPQVRLLRARCPRPQAGKVRRTVLRRCAIAT